MTSKELERLVGHYTFCSLLRREGLSVLCSCYDFIGGKFVRPRVLWPSVARELGIMQGILIFMRRRLDAERCPDVFAFDACGSGHASVVKPGAEDLIKEAMSWQERWRYKTGVSSRERALFGQDEIGGPELEETGMEPNPEFVEVRHNLVETGGWRQVHFTPMNDKEPIHLKEMRGYQAVLRSIVRVPKHLGTTISGVG